MTRSVLDLLDLNLAFSQQQLLRVDDFVRACERRGLALWAGHLEALHRVRALVPMYRVRRNLRPVFAAARRGDEKALYAEAVGGYMDTDSPSLQWARDHGRLRDPKTEPFRPWSSYRRSFGDLLVHASEFVYSPYQLLLVPEIRAEIQKSRYHRSRSGKPNPRLKPTNDRVERWLSDAAQNDSLVVALSALETRYRPEIVQRLTNLAGGSIDEVQRFIRGFDPVGMLTWLGWDAEQVRDSANRLLLVARSIDPLGEWHKLVRMARPEKWERLRRDALVANDYRIAGEMLLLFYEDLANTGAAPPLEPLTKYAPQYAWRERLRADDQDLDALLTEFGLSPHPALVLVLEGDTEMLLMPRVMTLLDIPRNRTFIEIVNNEGVDRDLETLVGYVAAPVPGDTSVGNGALMQRPPTRFLVVFDAERRYATLEKREKKRKDWIDRISKVMSQTYHISVQRDDLETLVYVDTWAEGQAFEFAHFTDDEIADAILRTYNGPDAPPQTELAKRVGGVRIRQGNIDKLWKGWRGRNPTKPEIADALWPTLERHITDALARDDLNAVPAARIAHLAYRLAIELPRHSVIIRRA